MRRRCSASRTRARSARCADSLLYVARLDRLTLDNVMDARDTLDRIEARPPASSSSARRSEASPYYVGVARAGARGRLSVAAGGSIEPAQISPARIHR